nr:MAG TPA: hypothetical protein [Bacteriophage sp.]
MTILNLNFIIQNIILIKFKNEPRTSQFSVLCTKVSTTLPVSC